MIFTETKLKGAFTIDVKRLEDDRGFFGRSYCMEEFDIQGLNINVMQSNVSFNKKKGTLRGMHMQIAPYGETKLVRCTRGSIYDVIVDLRPKSETYTQWVGVALSAATYRMLYVPEGFAHGFITMQDNTDVTYQVTQMYVPIAEKAYRWDDPAFDIKWPVDPVVVSDKDRSHAPFEPHIMA
ncbi:dTDP-4-dehydrorhamnose 3,5-epimerase [Mucilaginibacter achroorhodeus]|uniref:dTDP-4-dehydrorhamnose 3,5-epimerase n=1 Tax=Mucilaginibacter achroorhodeus TaxID=2599294 RepID=A0A563U6P1_9SPHI|nr:dTDP-4-dehydrorhamnose 3,5-epimerase [Mucilaginibacter achroorhodeus]TWR26993.1 dTDP-4-dehydrorhamnose 3,5-epimerase [Mucilaginibacter achroorhodeus]